MLPRRRLPIWVGLDRRRHSVTVRAQQEDAQRPPPIDERVRPVRHDVGALVARAPRYQELFHIVALTDPAQVGVVVPEALEGWADDTERRGRLPGGFLRGNHELLEVLDAIRRRRP